MTSEEIIEQYRRIQRARELLKIISRAKVEQTVLYVQTGTMFSAN